MKPFILFIVTVLLSLSSLANSAGYECVLKANTVSGGTASSEVVVNQSSGAQLNLLDFNFRVQFQQVSMGESVFTALGLFINDASTFVPLQTPWAYLKLPYSNGDVASIYCLLK